MKINYILEQLRDDQGVQAWLEHHPQAKLVHVFFMVQGNNYSEYHVGYYDEQTQKMTTFIVNGTSISIKEEGDLLKKDDSPLLPLDEKTLTSTVEEALDAAKKVQEKDYAKEIPLKIMVILQNLPDVGQVYNITYVTQSMKTLNIKVDAATAQVLSAQLISLFSTMGKPLDGLERK
ncbi:hypothetical protein D6774_02325 [Candidatus Woesearchaeota archaeon]|jgi:hypothetical protein|nr:MAG: hypothetical protein D6774_02325 [Candidatus Woesearchaeota archaeon]